MGFPGYWSCGGHRDVRFRTVCEEKNMKMRDCKVRKWLSALLALILLSSVLPISAGASQVYAGGFSAVVYSGDVAVYSDASLTNRIGTLDQTTVVTVNAFSGGVAHISTWYGASGFVDASALRTVEELAQPAIIRYDTRVYQQPSTSSTSGALSAGSTVNFLGAAGDWALIERGGIGGFTYVGALYVEGQDPEPTATPAPTQPSGGNYIPGTVTAISCPIYARNSTSSSQIGSLPSNTQLNVYAVSGGWAYIEWNGNYGFCQVSNLIPTQSLETYMDGTVVSAAPVYSGASTSSTYYGQMSVGTQVTVYSISSGWAFIRMGDYYGYCRVSNLTPGHVSTDPTPTPAPTATQPSGGNYIPGTVIAISCPIYASNSTGSTQIGTLPSNTQLNVYAVSGGWAYIEWNGNYGFCQVSNLIPTQSLETYMDGTVVSAAPVYSGASTSSTYYGQMSVGTQVTVYSISSGWAFIRMGDYYGYCRVSNLTPGHVGTDPTPTPAPTATPGNGTYIPGIVTASSVSIYASASTSSQQIGSLPQGTVVNVYAVSGGWAYIEWNGNYGFCSVSALEPYSGSTPSPTDGYHEEVFTATVVTSDARIYQSDSTSSTSASVSMGTNVIVGAYNAEWAYVNLDGTLGYMHISDLSRANYSTLQNGSSGSAVQSLETALLLLGYLDSNPGTSYTSYTESAVRLFQTACGMSETGVADEATQRVLFSGNAPWSDLFSRTYSNGDSGTNVGRIQLRLFALGYLSKSSSVDGDYGSTTANAVRLFQQANGLSVTGSVDASTLRQMYTTGAVRLPSGQSPADTNSGGKDPDGSGQVNNSTSIVDGLKSDTSSYSSSMSNAEKLEYVIYCAQNQLGKPYVYGATGMSSFDCSGLTYYAFRQISVTLPRTAQSQGYDSDYQQISGVSNLERGDLVFFNTVSDSDQCDHTGIYLGDGWFIHASSGQDRVVVSTLASGYYNRVFSWGRRVLG